MRFVCQYGSSLFIAVLYLWYGPSSTSVPTHQLVDTVVTASFLVSLFEHLRSFISSTSSHAPQICLLHGI